MSTHDPAPASSSVRSPAGSPAPPPDSSRRRSLALVAILALLLLALWYDYKVARPHVETAYDSVGKINDEYNSLPGKKYLTEKEVQTTLNRKPAHVIQEGDYHVEVYSWRAGLPIKSHNYYAVYSAGTPLIFLKHYKYELPMEELAAVKTGAVGGEEMSPEDRQKMNDTMGKGFQMRGPDAGPQPRPGSAEQSDSGESVLSKEGASADAAKEGAPAEGAAKEEAAKEEPTKEEPTKEEPAKTEPAKTEAATPEPATGEPK